VDVYNLTFALDPALRTIIHDGIHPDTDGQTVILDGLRWVFREMGLPTARPFVKGWYVGTPDQALSPAIPGTPLRTAQPDHPDPDHQLTEGFSIAAFRRWDEYGLLAKPDGHALPFTHSLVFRVGLPNGAKARSCHVKGTGIRHVFACVAAKLVPLAMASDKAGLYQVDLLAEAVANGEFRLVLEGDGKASLDWLAVATDGHDAPRWRAPDNEYREYRVEADHLQPGNRVVNPDFRTDEGWVLRDGAVLNRPFSRPVGPLAFADEQRSRLATLADPGPARAYDLLRVSGSTKGNDGAFRIRQTLGEGRFLTRRRNHGAEAGLSAILEHNDGCGLVSGGSCLELPRPDSVAEQRLSLPPGTRRVRLSLFHRAWDDQRLGTRDVPTVAARIVLASGGSFRELAAPSSFQWRKFAVELPVVGPALTLGLLGRADGCQLLTGIALLPLP
jgi:hypothetical protein